MDFRTLQNFVVVARTGSVSQAAEEVLITQPALSRQMQTLERDLKVRLFDRSRGRLTVSASGRELLPRVIDVLAANDRLRSVAQSLAAGRLDRITIATPATTETDIIAPFVATLGLADPVPSIVDLAGRNDTTALQAGADMVVGGDPRGQGLDRIHLCELPVWAYVPAGHAWATRSSVTLTELSSEPILALNPPFRARRILDDAAKEEDLVLSDVVECTGPQIAQALAAAGRGVAVLTDDPRFNLHALRITGDRAPITITLTASWSPTHHAAEALQQVAARLQAFCEARYGIGTAARGLEV
jgi:DNA-binding transcriptional LysR family regulator